MKRLFVSIYLLLCYFSQCYVESVKEITSMTENPGLFGYFGINKIWKPFWNNDEITSISTSQPKYTPSLDYSSKFTKTCAPVVSSTLEQPVGIFGLVKNWINVFKPKTPVTSLKPSLKKKTHIAATSVNSTENLETWIGKNHTISEARNKSSTVSLNISSPRTRDIANSPDTNLLMIESTPDVVSSSCTTSFTATNDSSVELADKFENTEEDTASSTNSDEDIITTIHVTNISNVDNTTVSTLSEESTYLFSLNSNITEETNEIESNIEPYYIFEHATSDHSVGISTLNNSAELTSQPENFISSEPINETVSCPNKSTLLYFSFYNADDLNDNSTRKEGKSPKVVLSGFYIRKTKKYKVSMTHKRRRVSKSKKNHSTKLTTSSKFFLYY